MTTESFMMSDVNEKLKPESSTDPRTKDTELDGIDDGLLTPEIGIKNKKDDGLPDINVYQHKKTLAQGMMDLALLSANANQLRYVLERGTRHTYYYTSLIFILMSIILQVSVGIGLIWNSRYNIHKDQQMHMANRINNFTVVGIFAITILNVFISAFGMPGSDEFLPVVQLVNNSTIS